MTLAKTEATSGVGLLPEVLAFSSTTRTEWGALWEGKGLLYDLLSAALCGPAS